MQQSGEDATGCALTGNLKLTFRELERTFEVQGAKQWYSPAYEVEHWEVDWICTVPTLHADFKPREGYQVVADQP